MAKGRRREEWEHTLAVIQAWSTKPIDVEALNPVKPLHVEHASNPEGDKVEAKESWGNLRAALQEYVNGCGRK